MCMKDFCFIPIHGHKGKSLNEEMLGLLKGDDLYINECRAESNDNAYNM